MADMNLNVGIDGFKSGTNIKDIKVPEILRNKYSCGIDWVDSAMGGNGFTASTCGMITGTPGAGKTTFLLQLANAITFSGNECIFNTGEESLYQVAMTVERLKLRYGFSSDQNTNMPSFLEFAEKHYEKTCAGKKNKNGSDKALFLLIDSLQTMNDGKYKDGGVTGNTPMRCTEMLTNFSKTMSKNGKPVIVLFIGQVTKSGDFAGKNGIKHAIDMHLHLCIDEDQRSESWGERVFTNYKNRFGCAGRTFVLGMSDKGLYKKGEYIRDKK